MDQIDFEAIDSDDEDLGDIIRKAVFKKSKPKKAGAAAPRGAGEVVARRPPRFIHLLFPPLCPVQRKIRPKSPRTSNTPILAA